MKAYKIMLDAYDVIVQEEPGDENKKKRTVCPKYELPRILCNPSLSKESDGKPSKTFDLMELGPIAQRIEQAKDMYVNVSSQELNVLKSRIKEISHLFGYNSYELLRRVIDAQNVDLVEKK